MSLIVGTYWPARRETREGATARWSRFLNAIAPVSPMFASWYRKGASRRTARRPIEVDVQHLAAAMRVNRGDADRAVIEELGYSLSAWNGDEVSFSSTIGSFSDRTGNRAVLTLGTHFDTLTPFQWRSLLQAAVEAFDPDEGIVTSHAYLELRGATRVTHAGFLRYVRDGDIEQCPEAIEKMDG